MPHLSLSKCPKCHKQTYGIGGGKEGKTTTKKDSFIEYKWAIFSLLKLFTENDHLFYNYYLLTSSPSPKCPQVSGEQRPGPASKFYRSLYKPMTAPSTSCTAWQSYGVIEAWWWWKMRVWNHTDSLYVLLQTFWARNVSVRTVLYSHQ